MKKFFLILFSFILFVIPICYADSFDTNYVDGSVSQTSPPGTGSGASNYKYWDYYKTTGTRYVLRVYDWNTEKYIAVPKEYYINHIKSSNNEVMFLGVDKKEDGSYTTVKSGKSIFTDTTYEHVLQWFNNPKVRDCGLTKNDIDLLAGIIKDSAIKNGNTILAKSMQDVIDGLVPFDVRAEILFLMKVPGSDGSVKTGKVVGKGSVENYNFTFYANKKGSWRKEYLTYLEVKAVCYAFGDDGGNTMKAYWLDKVACALYEDDYDYVFANGEYQCSCDLYRRRFGSDVVYKLNSSNKITLNQPAYRPGNKSDRWYMYYVPGRCGIPIDISGKTYYLTPGKTYPDINGQKVAVDSYIKFTDTNKGIKAQNTDYLSVVTNDPNHATIYEGWDYITNRFAAILVIAVDKDTGNIISLNNVPYSKFENVGAGNYQKTAWKIDGYRYLGNITKDDFSIPNVPIGIEDSGNIVNISISEDEAKTGAKRQVIFVYERESNNVNDQEARITIYNVKDGINTIMFMGEYAINDGKLDIKLYDKTGTKKYTESIDYNLQDGFSVNTDELEEVLGINLEKFEYVGNLIKTHPEYFLTYLGEELSPNKGDIYNLNNIKNDKVHIIVGYEPNDGDEEIKGDPELKISYVDDKGNPLPGKDSKITKEEVGKEITSKAEDYRKDNYIYVGYTYVDTKNDFGDIDIPITVISKDETVLTKFDNPDDRRHIIFIYKKIELKFEIDIIMNPDDLENQLIGQRENEDYWVLDEAGKVILKVTVTGDEGLDILNYSVKLRIPFDTFMNGSFVPANSINNLTVTDLSNIIVADRLIVPVWVKEEKYNIDASIEANVERFGIVSASKKDDVEVVGRLYDFTVTNLDGSSKTGDEKWKESLFGNIDNEYKANVLPIGQKENQPDKYNYGIKLGTNFYFSINTKGIKNYAISIEPKFLYVTEDGKTIKEVDIYFNENGKMKNILDDGLAERFMKLRDNNVLKESVIKEVERAQLISKVLDRYNYSTTVNRSIGRFSNVNISKYLSLPYLNYINEFKALYGNNALELANKTENELLINASHWYGKYVVPASSIIVDKGASPNGKVYKDGYLIVCFKIISLDSNGGEYLSYDLPISNTQWQKENLNQNINLPMIKNNDTEKSIIVDTLKDGYAPVIIYQVGISINDNNTSVGTH